jgi:hypothetical protein
MEAASGMHRELSQLMASVLAISVRHQQTQQKSEDDLRSNHLSLDATTVTAESLQLFLQSYAPLQFLADRGRNHQVALPRRLLNHCKLVHHASALIDKASISVRNNSTVANRLAEVLQVGNKRIALPHRLWTSRHDAVLIQAIAKHGWIDHDACAQAIRNDTSIRWGSPFDTGGRVQAPDVEMTRDLSETMTIQSARKAASFLNEKPDLVRWISGDRLIRTYQLVLVTNESNIKVWVPNGSSQPGLADETDAELPPKKELAKRAKMLLSRFTTRDISQGNESGTAARPSTGDGHGYAILDQSDSANVFLAELLRGATKGKVGSDMTKLCVAAFFEGHRLKSCIDSVQGSSEHENPLLLARSNEMKAIIRQIDIVRRNYNSRNRASKNVLRVMLGEEPHPPQGPNDVMFPVDESTEESLPRTNAPQEWKSTLDLVQDKSNIKKPSKKAAQKALERNITSAEDAIESGVIRAMNGISLRNPSSLLLTYLESLILRTVCSLGMPLWTENWQTTLDEAVRAPFSLSWVSLGKNLEKLSEMSARRALQGLMAKRKTWENALIMTPDERDAAQESLEKADSRYKAALIAFDQAKE